jgi:hypothetical protein
MSEHDFEPIRGLPGDLPAGETLLWQGAPNWWMLAQQAFHVRALAAYFAVMLLWRTGSALIGGQAPLSVFRSVLLVTPIALTALAMLTFLAWLNSRTTVYTITTRRVVMRFGVAVPKAINIPFAIIEGAAMKPLSRDGGDLALTLTPPNKIAFLHLWPHARPWRMSSPQPTFRALSDARSVAGILASAMEAQIPIALTKQNETARDAAAGLARPETVAA